MARREAAHVGQHHDVELLERATLDGRRVQLRDVEALGGVSHRLERGTQEGELVQVRGGMRRSVDQPDARAGTPSQVDPAQVVAGERVTVGVNGDPHGLVAERPSRHGEASSG